LRCYHPITDVKLSVVHEPTVSVVSPQAQEAITATEVMFEEGKGRAGGEGVQPEGDLGQLDRHRVLVHAVHDALEDHPPHEVLIVKLRLVNLPAASLRQIENALADRRYALDQWRLVGVLDFREWHQARRGGDRFENSIGEEIDQRDEKMA
jgi:hypothetical protein